MNSQTHANRKNTQPSQFSETKTSMLSTYLGTVFGTIRNVVPGCKIGDILAYMDYRYWCSPADETAPTVRLHSCI